MSELGEYMTQSNEPTIEQMNEVIAQFAEIKSFDDSRYGLLYVSPSDGKTCFSLRYHCSWDWLQPVWVKFRDLKFQEETHMKLHLNYVARLAQDIAYGTIDEFHHNLHIAITWYNQQTTTNENS